MPNILQPLLLLLMSSIIATNPAEADDHLPQIRGNATSATVQLCGTKKACKSIHFSAIVPETISDDVETDLSDESDAKPSLIDNINVLLFGL